MLNIEKYKKEIIEFAKVKYSNLTLLQRFMADKTGINYKKIFNTQVLDWLTEEYKEPILDEAEKEYLRSVIKPFRKRVAYICKIVVSDNDDEEYIYISGNDNTDAYSVYLPNFPRNTMYKGMKSMKRYTLDELGL